jgi:hypothetical protein
MREAPSVEEAAQRWSESISIIGVAWSGDNETYSDFIEEGGLTFPNIDDTAGEIYNRFQVPYQPAAVLIRPDGSSQLIRGAFDAARLEASL